MRRTAGGCLLKDAVEAASLGFKGSKTAAFIFLSTLKNLNVANSNSIKFAALWKGTEVPKSSRGSFYIISYEYIQYGTEITRSRVRT